MCLVVRKWVASLNLRNRFPLLILLSLVYSSLNLNAQVERATITGVLTDASGANIPGAIIKIRDEGTNQETSLQSDAAGSYSAGNLTPGSYTITVEKEGFSKHINRGFVVQVGQTARLDIVMEVGSVNQTVEVTTATPVLQSENAAVGQVISGTAVAQLPLNGRNLAQLAVITPGVTGLNYAPVNTINAGARPDELRPGGRLLKQMEPEIVLISFCSMG